MSRMYNVICIIGNVLCVSSNGKHIPDKTDHPKQTYEQPIKMLDVISIFVKKE